MIKKITFFITASLLLAGCSSANEFKFPKNESKYAALVKITPEKVTLEDSSAVFHFEWVYGSDSDSMDKHSLNELNVTVKGYQNGKEIPFNPEKSSNINSKSYEGSDSFITYGFDLDNTEDKIELVVSRKGEYTDPGYFVDIAKKDKDKSDDEIKRENYLLFYKRALEHNMNDFALLLKSLENVNIEDAKFLASELKLNAPSMNDVEVDGYIDEDFNKLIRSLSESYVDFATYFNTINFNQTNLDEETEIFSALSATVGSLTREISDKYYDGKQPESTKMITE